jgi:hypothetical protein
MGRWQRTVDDDRAGRCCGLSISLIFTAIGPVVSSLSARYGGSLRGDVIAQLMMTLPSVGVIMAGRCQD